MIRQSPPNLPLEGRRIMADEDFHVLYQKERAFTSPLKGRQVGIVEGMGIEETERWLRPVLGY